MADDELAGLSREELLELVRRQQDELAAREAAIERRDAKIRELEEELAQFRRPAKTPENSSVPPSCGQKATRGENRRRKLGPKRGHVGVSRVRSEPDVVVACRPRACAGCGQELPQVGGRRGLGHPLHHPRHRAQAGPEPPAHLPRRRGTLSASGRPYPVVTCSWVVTPRL
jgi:transposase